MEIKRYNLPNSLLNTKWKALIIKPQSINEKSLLWFISSIDKSVLPKQPNLTNMKSIEKYVKKL
jgi:hypothetical protein